MIGKYARVTDREVLEETYLVFDRYIYNAPYVRVEGVKTVLNDLAKKDPKAPQARPEDFVDNRFAEELDRSGYIPSLYR